LQVSLIKMKRIANVKGKRDAIVHKNIEYSSNHTECIYWQDFSSICCGFNNSDVADNGFLLFFHYSSNTGCEGCLLFNRELKLVIPQMHQSLDVANLIRSFLNIFPAAVFGILLTKATRRTFLYGATC